jgi:hypothetical protein
MFQIFCTNSTFGKSGAKQKLHFSTFKKGRAKITFSTFSTFGKSGAKPAF